MDEVDDRYKTIAAPSEEILYKDKKSKFYGYAYPITKESEVKDHIETLKKKHPSANHVCYAWQIGIKSPVLYRANDDGEPNNSAGMPIYGQLQSFGVTNVLVAVVRIFGGTKLGVGGLISAYRSAAQLALENSKIVTRTIKKSFQLHFTYPQMDIVMRTIKQKELRIVSQKMEMECEINILVREKDAHEMEKIFKSIQGVAIRKKD
ncbi:putative YigZ family protein [Flavobacteriaceae bacterium MAR_2009_75]|nr:putative YigZ family protein [Flavobacteriaceae bacterium MAR_2009_75]